MRTAIVTVLLLALPAFAADPAPPAVVVTGTGEVSVKPDTAQVQVGVTTQAQTASQALKANNEAMDVLLKALTSRGIAEKDVQTSNFHVSPQYRHQNPGQAPELAGYQATNQVGVRVRNLKDLGPLLDDLVTKGANQVHGVSFTVADPRKVLDEARGKAVQDARRRAEHLAREAGVKLGRILRIQEGADPGPPEPKGMFFGAAREAAVPIAPGEQRFEAAVTVSFALVE
jgi:uncharacterized protein